MKAAIYGRVSSEKQEREDTIQSQLAALRDFAKKDRYSIVDEYLDNGFSGELLARPGLDQLRDDARRKRFEAVLIHSPDRLSRKLAYQIVIKEELSKYGVQLIFLNQPQGGETPENNLLVGMQGLIAEYEKAKILERTRRGRLFKARQGLVVGNKPPYGYTYIRQDRANGKPGRYEINESETKVVRLIFDLLINKRISIRGIARELTKREIKPREGIHWRSSTLHRILRNETYAGTTYFNKHIAGEPVVPRDNGYKRRKNTSLKLRPREEWVPIKLSDDLRIISPEFFKQAQVILKENARLLPKNVKGRYLLGGRIFCGNCSSPYHGTPYHGRPFYRCANRHRMFPLPRVCRMKSIHAPLIERVVWESLKALLKNPSLIMQQVERFEGEKGIKGGGLKQELEKLEKKIKKTAIEEDRLLDAYRSEVIDLVQLKTHVAEIKEKQETLGSESEELKRRIELAQSSTRVKRSVHDYCQGVASKLDNADFEHKKLIIGLLKRITFEGHRVKINGAIPVPATGPSNGGVLYPSVGDCAHRPRRFRSPSSRIPGL